MSKTIVTVLTFFATTIFVITLCEAAETKQAKKPDRPKRLLLIGQSPDKHPYLTHEYMAAMRVLTKCLQSVDGLQTIIVKADEPWERGPEMLDGADGVVVFVSEGAKWLQQEKTRLAAFQKLAKRGGGLACIHWGMGTRDAKPIDDYLKLFGGCHGGPDRKYKVVDVIIEHASPNHPILSGVEAMRVHEEFYYSLKFVKPAKALTPLIRVEIEGTKHVVSWAWNRPDGGRSYGFSGCHFHKNWERPDYRRMVTQAVLWTLKKPIPKNGINVDVAIGDLAVPKRDK